MTEPTRKEPDPDLYDAAAEKCLLGSLLLVSRLIDDVIPIVRPEDFYVAANQTIFETMLAMHNADRRIDAKLLPAALKKAGKLSKDEGGPGITMAYLVEIAQCVPIASHAVHYARVIRDRAILRGLYFAGTAIVADASQGEGEPGERLNRAEDSIMAIQERRVSESVTTLSETLVTSLLNLDKRIAGEAVENAVNSGFGDLDFLLGGLRGGELIVLAARPSMGKAQPLDAPVLVTDGFRPMGLIDVGDRVIGGDGEVCNVTGVFPQGELEVFRVIMSDGTSTECCDDHLWFTQNRRERRNGFIGSVKSLREIRNTLLVDSETRPQHRIPIVGPVKFADCFGERSIDPYALGLLLGDGTFDGAVRLHNSEPDIQERFAQALDSSDTITLAPAKQDIRVRRAKRTNGRSETAIAIERCGLKGADSYTKHVPMEYLFAPPGVRLEVLRGLFDSDGYVVDSGQSIEFTTSSNRLAEDVAFLARSLGGIVSSRKRDTRYKLRGKHHAGKPSHRMNIWFPNGIIPVGSKKHLARWRNGPSRFNGRTIVSVESVGIKPCQCIRVDSTGSLYVTTDFIVTHNSALAANITEAVSESGKGVLFISLEMSRLELADRMLCSYAEVDMHKVRGGFVTQGNRQALMEAASKMSQWPLMIDDAPERTVNEISAAARRMKRKGNLALVVIDYLQLIDSDNPKDVREQQVARMSRRLKGLARALSVPVLCLAQLNRQNEQRTDKRPRLSDLRESGAIEQDADVVLFIHRPEVYDANDKPGIAEVEVAKQRNGRVGKVELVWRSSITRFESKSNAGEEWQPDPAGYAAACQKEF